MVSRSYQSMLQAQQLAVAQTKAIQQYMQLGCQLETKKKWAQAESSFKYVLQIMSRQDGPGNSKRLPALEHLVSVTKAQNKLDEAINFQETVLAFKKATTPASPNEVVQAQGNLSDLLIQNNDYANAASVLRQSVSYYNANPSLPRDKKRATMSSYARVLRKLQKDEEAKSVEDANADETKSANDVHVPMEVVPLPTELPKATKR